WAMTESRFIMTERLRGISASKAARTDRRAALIPYVVAGYPDADTSFEIGGKRKASEKGAAVWPPLSSDQKLIAADRKICRGFP
ncbi:MAG TPA: hypothetical protein VK192_03620, partial [Sphingomicrobium sp.]|nr:hypothetical protein [Sphingomicrobium sp.]